MNCYCKERESNPKLADTMEDIPKGYCGLCEICGKPGHTCAHPRLATTGTWCDEHWNELITYRIITLGDIVPFAFYTVITGMFIYTMVSAWNVFFK